MSRGGSHEGSGRLRIVGGEWSGRPIEAPDGRGVTRPTTDRTRERIASMVLSSFDLDLAGVAVLDAFAGSGALGLEMLSRGALTCCFVDRDRSAAARVRRNAQSLGAGERAHVTCGDAVRLAEAGTLWGAPYALVLLDPPYAMEARRVSALVGSLGANGLLAPRARILYERSSDALGLDLPAARLVKSKSHGISAVDLLIME